MDLIPTGVISIVRFWRQKTVEDDAAGRAKGSA